MAQHDYIIANQSGAAFRADLNNALAAIVSQNSGAAEPSVTYAYQPWADTTTGLFKIRNAANSAWITLYQLDGEWSTIALEDGTAAAPSLYFKDSGTDTGVYSPGVDQVGIATAGVQRVNFNGATEVVFNDGGADVDFRVEGDTEPNLFKIDAGTDQVQVKNLNGGPLAGTRNRIINGDMRIDQRNNGASVTPTSSTYTVDRWVSYITQASKFSVQRNAGSVTPPAGFVNYLGITSLSSYSVLSTDYFDIVQNIEGLNTADLAWGTGSATNARLSFWVRSSLTGTFGGAISSTNRYFPFSYTISSSNTWEYKTIAITGDTSGTWATDNSLGIQVRFSLGAGATYLAAAGTWTATPVVGATGQTSVVGTSGATFYITGVQLEPGTVATPFERRSYGQELVLCQRYYEKSLNIDTAPGTNTGLSASIEDFAVPTGSPARVRFAVSKRANPTTVVYDAAGSAGYITTFNPGQNNLQPPLAVDNQGMSGFKVFMTQTGLTRVAFHWTASAEL